MAPLDSTLRRGTLINQRDNTYIPLRESLTEDGLILEAWGEGWNVGALIILLLIVICNYRNRIVLHKLILLEVNLFQNSVIRRNQTCRSCTHSLR